MMIKNVLISSIFTLTLCCAIAASAQVPADSTLYPDFQEDTTSQVVDCVGCIPDLKYKLGVFANAGNSELAPYYMASNTGGIFTQQYSALVQASISHPLKNYYKRFNWGAGIEAWGGYSSSAGYERYTGNDQFEVQQINNAALKLMNLRSADDVLGDQVVRILDPLPFMTVQSTGRSVVNQHAYLAEYRRYVEQIIVQDRESRMMVCSMRDITNEETEREKKEKITQQTVEVADKVVEKQMRIVQEIASLLGETAAETKIALAKLKESITDE